MVFYAFRTLKATSFRIVKFNAIFNEWIMNESTITQSEKKYLYHRKLRFAFDDVSATL